MHSAIEISHTPEAVPRPSPERRDARRARRRRAQARVDEAARRQPELRIDRLGPILRVLRAYREPANTEIPVIGPLASYVRDVQLEVELLEARVGLLPRRSHLDTAAIRRALCFLRSFGRIGALDFELIPPEERPHLVTLLSLEYRWCFAAAETTPRAFKVAIGRTGAR